MATRFNQRRDWLRYPARQSTGHQAMGPIEGVGGLTTEQLYSEIHARRSRCFTPAPVDYEDRSPGRMRNLQTESSPADCLLNPTYEEFATTHWQLHGSDGLFTSFDEVETPARNERLPQPGGGFSQDMDYRPRMNVNGPLPVCHENYSDFGPRRPDVAIPSLLNLPVFAARRGRRLRGRGFQNYDSFRSRGKGPVGFDDSQQQQQLRQDAPPRRMTQSRFEPPMFFHHPATLGFGHHPDDTRPRGRGNRRSIPGNLNWRPSYHPQASEHFNDLPSLEPQYGNAAPFNDHFHRNPKDRRMGPQCQNARLFSDQDFENDESFQAPWTFNDRHLYNHERFETPVRNLPRRFHHETPFNPIGLRPNNDAPLGSINSNVPSFRQSNFNPHQQGDCNPISPRSVANSGFCSNVPATPRNDGLARNLQDARSRLRGIGSTRPAFRASRQFSLLVGRARQSMRMLAARRNFLHIQRLRRLNNPRKRNLEMRRARVWQNLRNSFHGDENLHPGASVGSLYKPVFLSSIPNRRRLPKSKLRNFDLEDQEEDETPAPEEDWDADPPSAPFFIGAFINKKSTFMIANAAPRQKKKPGTDQQCSTAEIDHPNAPVEVIDINDDHVHDTAEDGANFGEKEIIDEESDVDFKQDQNSGSVVDLISPCKEKSAPDAEFLIDLSMSSEDNSMSCEIVSEFFTLQNRDSEEDLKEEAASSKIFRRYFQDVNNEDLEGNNDSDDLQDEARYPLHGENVIDLDDSPDGFHDSALEGVDCDENASARNDASDDESHDDNVEEGNFLMNDVAREENDASGYGNSGQDVSRGRYFHGWRDTAAQQSEDSEDESACELDLINIHPDPDCPEDFLDVDDAPGPLPIPTGDNQANRPDVTRKRVYNGPAPSGLLEPPSPHNFTWGPGRPRRLRTPRYSTFIKRSHLIKMHHQSPSYDILHQEFPDDCNSDRDTEAR